AYYDTVLDITWLRSFGDYSQVATAGADHNLADHHAATVAYVDALSLFGVDDWRLPSAARSFAWGTVNEMAYLRSVTLGLTTCVLNCPNNPYVGTSTILGSDGNMLFNWNAFDNFFTD